LCRHRPSYCAVFRSVIGRVLDGVLRDQKSQCIERCECSVRGLADGVAADFTRNAFEPDAISAAADDIAILNADIEAILEVDESAPLRELDSGPIERQAGEGDATRAFASDQR
jgi:hypothetical protein